MSDEPKQPDNAAPQDAAHALHGSDMSAARPWRQPWTLHLFVMKELLKVLLLCTFVLVMVISMAAAIKPMSDGLLDAWSLIRFIAYFMPTTLQFALPFAGAFASTLVFNRMAADNEITACSATGMSYLNLLLPVAALGIVLSVAMFGLSHWVVPGFYRSAEQLLQKDFVKLVVTQVDKRQSIVLPDDKTVLYADAADASAQPPVIEGSRVQPSDMILLRGVAIGQLEANESIRSEATAEKADLLLFHHEDQTYLTARLENVTYFDPQAGRLVRIGVSKLGPERIPSPFREDPRFFSWSDLMRMSATPGAFDKVAEQRMRLVSVMSGERLRSLTLAGLEEAAKSGRALILETADQQRYHVAAPAVAVQGNDILLTASGDNLVRLDYVEAGRVRRQIESQRVRLRVDFEDPTIEPRIMAEAHNARVRDLVADASTEHRQYDLPSLYWPEPVLEAHAGVATAALLQEADALVAGGAEPVGRYALNLRASIASLLSEILAQQHLRAAISILCFLLLAFGAVLSMKNRQSTPLVVYFWSFLIAVLALVVVYAGQNVVAGGPEHMKPALALGVLWGGNLLVLVALALNYHQLAKH